MTLTEPLDRPALVGAKVTAILHVALGFKDVGQLFPSKKGPLDRTFVILKETDELLVMVSNCGPLVAPVFVLANVMELGASVAVGGVEMEADELDGAVEPPPPLQPVITANDVSQNKRIRRIRTNSLHPGVLTKYRV
jgi:hypothetical protein